MAYPIYTIAFIAITALISFIAFGDRNLYGRLILYPKVMHDAKEQHRFLSHGFIHADQMHLLFNMLTLYFFGTDVETYYMIIGKHYHFLALYLLGIVVASIPSYIKHRNDAYYASVGASGGTSAVVFALVYISPWSEMFFGLPAVIYAILYVAYTVYMSKQNRDNINHDAHLWGTLFGFVFTFIFDPYKGQLFLNQILHPPFLS